MSSETEGMPDLESWKVWGGYDLLPRYFPERELLGPYVDLLRARKEDTEDASEDELRSIHWTIALENAFESADFAASIAGFQMVTFGFANPYVEGPGFGVIVYTAPSDVDELASFHPIAREVRPVPSSPYMIKVGKVIFPVFIRQFDPKLHSLPVNPLTGTAACWATSRRPQLASRKALLTAKHALQQTILGRSIPLTWGSGKLIDVAPEGVDAALVEVSCPVANQPIILTRSLRTKALVAQWIDVDLHTQHTVIRTKVVEVNSSRGSLHYSLPLRIFLAHSANPGDSGSLVTTPGGVGIGMYMGSLRNPATQASEGFCQHLAQAASALQLDLWL